MSPTERSRKYRAAKKLHPGQCACGRPATTIQHGAEGVCDWCAHRHTGLLVIHRQKAGRTTKGPRANRGLVARMVDAFETNGRGWGTWDAFLQQHPEIS